ncbi:MAG: molybdenum cofactor guanylyltransferase MobA [Gammaproteobacteria bacterium]|jgi:molybdenum cofactor guanylyltransferase
MASFDMKDRNVTALILAGGKGRRMGGSDKGLTRLNGRPMIEYCIDAISPQVDRILINANRNLDTYRTYGHEIVRDALADYQGPLAGFQAGFMETATDFMVTLPCDGPRVAPDLVQRLLTAITADNAEIAVAHDGKRMQPVYALLRSGLRQSLERFLATGDRKIDRWYAQHRTVTADFSDCIACFNNINTPQERSSEERRMRGREEPLQDPSPATTRP